MQCIDLLAKLLITVQGQGLFITNNVDRDYYFINIWAHPLLLCAIILLSAKESNKR
jgi:hypothetical protein